MKAQGYTRETILKMGMERSLPPFRPGDRLRITERIKEGDKERIQYFEGDVIAVHNCGIASTVTIRRIGANSVAIERIFPLYSSKFEFTFVREGDVRRAKLYYLRDRVGKLALVKEKVRKSADKGKAREQAQA